MCDDDDVFFGRTLNAKGTTKGDDPAEMKRQLEVLKVCVFVCTTASSIPRFSHILARSHLRAMRRISDLSAYLLLSYTRTARRPRAVRTHRAQD